MDCVVPKQKPFTVEGMLISKKLRKFTKVSFVYKHTDLLRHHRSCFVPEPTSTSS